MYTRLTLTSLFLLTLICLVNHAFAHQVVEGTMDLDTLATDSTLDASHLIVGEVTDVSFVFEMEPPDGGTSGPLSIVTARIHLDMHHAIERAENDDKEMDEPAESVSFSQIGGPYPNGDIVQAVGAPLLEVGDYVFLRLSPTTYPVTNNELTVNACTTFYGSVHVVDEDGNDDIADHTVKKSWRSLDVSVADMTRIVRATLKRPNEMRAFERDLVVPAKEARYQALMEKIESIEKDLDLPEITHD